VVAWLILQQRWEAACWLFLAAAVSDGIDGLLARWLNQITQLGAALDTVADKALGVVTLVMLTQVGAIPLWVTMAILLRDSGHRAGCIELPRAGRPSGNPSHLAWQDSHVCRIHAADAGAGGLAGLLALDGLAASAVRDGVCHRRGVRRAVCVDMERQGPPRARGGAAGTALNKPEYVHRFSV
jgi:cardiolipin synthase (CMP-forming)